VKAAKLPVNPVWYRAILEAHKLNCSEEMLSLAALASTQQSIFVRPYPLRYIADEARRWWLDGTSDHLSQLSALHAYAHVKFGGGINIDQWCFDAFLNRRVLDEVLKIRDQLYGPACQLLLGGLRSTPFGDETYADNIRKALARSFFHQSAFHTGDGDLYTTVHDNCPAGIHPESGLIDCQHQWVIFNSFIYSGKQYIQNVTAVDPTWLMVRASDSTNLIISTNSI
jgi:pre-mRNA-splicing factor ATP-dependent RNA helicase DHX15/PRP43